MANGDYFYFNKGSVKSEITALNTKYTNVVKSGMAIGTLLSKYVCVKDKWNDDNAVVFASWWNQNDTAGAGGVLKWDSTNKKLYMSKQTDSLSDGEDRIRQIVSMAGIVYYLTTCRAFTALESSFSDQLKTYSAYVTLGNNKEYSEKTDIDKASSYAGQRWPKMMYNLLGDSNAKWTNTTLNTKANGNVTSATDLKTLADTLAKNLTTLNTNVDEFCAEVTKVVTNTDTSKYWGFSTSLYKKILSTVKSTNTKTQSKLKTFANSTNLALSTANNVIATDLAKLSNISFS